MAKIKICGIKRQEDIDSINAAIPDYIGFVFAKSKREVTPEAADAMKKRLSPNIKAIGVFVDAEIGFISGICEKNIIDVIQLHGAETPDYITKIKTVTGKPVIKAFSMKNNEEIGKAENSPADFILFDTYSPEAAGGTGRTFDWNMVKNIRRSFFLAGGLNIFNIEVAFRELNPFCFDVSGGVETDGFKDKNKITDIIKLVRSLK